MRLKLFEEFNSKEHEPMAVALLKSVYEGENPEWIEPVRNGKLDLPEAEDGSQEGSVIFELRDVSAAIDYKVYYEVREGRKGDGYNTPDDPDETTLTDIEIARVDISEEGTQIAEYDRGTVEDAAWLFMYKLLPEEGDSSTKKKATKLKEKLGWK